MTFSMKITTPISSDNLQAHIENLLKVAEKWAFLATLESGNNLGFGLLRASKGV